MPIDPKILIQRVRDASARLQQAQDLETKAIIEALRHDAVRQADVVRASGYSREHLRRLAREHGIEPRREASDG